MSPLKPLLLLLLPLLLQAYGMTGAVGIGKGLAHGCGEGRWFHAVPIKAVAPQLAFEGITIMFDFKRVEGC